MSTVSLFNPTSVPQHLDVEGRVLGAGEHGTGDPTSKVIADALDEGRLIVIPPAVSAPVPAPRGTKPRSKNQEG